MVRLQTSDASDFELIPEGEIVNVVLDKVEPDQYEWNGETIDKLKWYFTVTDEGQFNGLQVRGSTSTAFTNHPNCRAYNWVQAITGKKYQEGEGLDTDDLSGMRARIIIKHREDKNKRLWHDVRDVLPAGVNRGPVPDDEAPF